MRKTETATAGLVKWRLHCNGEVKKTMQKKKEEEERKRKEEQNEMDQLKEK